MKDYSCYYVIEAHAWELGIREAGPEKTYCLGGSCSSVLTLAPFHSAFPTRQLLVPFLILRGTFLPIPAIQRRLVVPWTET